MRDTGAGGEIEAVFGPDGSLARIMPGFEYRPPQAAMAACVRQALAAGTTAAIEAGTGTGKSLAYLYPGLIHARSAGKPLIVSTNTINLQEQLLAKDLPTLARLGLSPRASLLLGRRNYLCRRRLAAVLARGTGESVGELASALDEAAASGRGERQALGFSLPDEAWAPVSSDAEHCLRQRCPWAGACFWQAARRAASEAEIVLVNHHLLLADAAVRQNLGWDAEHAVLPAYDTVIFDEAHHLEEIATEYFSLRLGSHSLARTLDRLYRREGPAQLGILPLFHLGLPTSGAALPPARAADARALAESAMAAVEGARMRAEAFFRSLSNLARGGRGDGTACQRRYQGDLRALDAALGPAAEDLILVLTGLNQTLQKILEAWEGPDADEPGTEEGMGAKAIHAELAGVCAAIPLLLDGESREHVFWLEARHQGGAAGVEAVKAPLEIGPVFRAALLDNLHAAVFTSATLAAGGEFTFFRERLGLPAAGGTELVLASPFDYRRRVLLAVPVDLPEPDEPGFAEAAAAFLASLFRATRGRTLVLFTSFAALDRVAARLLPSLPPALRLLRQGERPRAELLAEFARDDGAVLFGTDSFWEGVDVPGIALCCVVMARLPFRVPTEPVAEARAERLAEEGRSPFYDYALPQAVIKFKQGFGRLVRRGDDGGVVVVLDRRILTKRYGRDFLAALPPCTECFGTGEEVIGKVGEWIGRMGL